MKALAPLLVSLVLIAVACQDGGDEHRFRVPLPGPLAVQAQPYRELVWGDVNIIHTTDTHGWLLGHQKSPPPESNYNGTLGDLASFVSRMNTTAQNKGYDFLLVDTGDLRDGTGLSDGHPKGQWAGEETDKFFLRLPYDVMTIGNHELYNPPTIAYDMHANFSKKTKRYLTSNAFIKINGDNGLTKTVPIGWQFAKFKTPRKQLNVTAFGVTFNATGISPNVSVQPAEIMVNQPWFLDAIKERPSFFLLTGHMSVGERFNDSDWRAVVKPIRDLHKDTPIIILGGHTHTRNCAQFDDDKVVAIESGAFMDTVGWLSFNLSNTDKPLDYSRRYLDPNRVTYKYHTHAQNDEDFDTDEGKSITKDLWKLYDDFHLSRVWGSSPKDYTLFRVSNNSVLDLFVGEALPGVLNNVTCKGSKERPKFFFINSGVLRYDIYEGIFDQNDQLTAAPYPDKLWCVSNVTLVDAKRANNTMNGSKGQAYLPVDLHEAQRKEIADVDAIRRNWLLQMSTHADPELQQDDLTLGYVTTDQCGNRQAGDGDDVRHNPISFLSHLPKIVIGPSTVNATLVDLVILDHGWRDVLGNLSVPGHTYTESDIDKHFTNLTTNEVLGKYAQIAWPPPNQCRLDCLNV